METNDHAKRLADSTVILCLRYGALFCHAQTKLEAITYGADKANTFAFPLWLCGYNPATHVYFSEILQYSLKLLSACGAFVVLVKYICVRTVAFATFLLSEKE